MGHNPFSSPPASSSGGQGCPGDDLESAAVYIGRVVYVLELILRQEFSALSKGLACGNVHDL